MPILQADYANLNHEEMAKSIGLKAKFVPMLIGSFVEESAPLFTQIEEAIATKEYEPLRSAAHSIKGSSGNLHFNEIYEMAKEMELAAANAEETFAYSEYLNAIKALVATIPA